MAGSTKATLERHAANPDGTRNNWPLRIGAAIVAAVALALCLPVLLTDIDRGLIDGNPEGPSAGQLTREYSWVGDDCLERRREEIMRLAEANVFTDEEASDAILRARNICDG